MAGARRLDPRTDFIRTCEAAQLLGVDPQTLRIWESRLHFPRAVGVPGTRRQFSFQEVVELRNAIMTEHSVAAAVSSARANLATERLRATEGMRRAS